MVMKGPETQKYLEAQERLCPKLRSFYEKEGNILVKGDFGL